MKNKIQFNKWDILSALLSTLPETTWTCFMLTFTDFKIKEIIILTFTFFLVMIRISLIELKIQKIEES